MSVNVGDTAWVLVAAALVIFMTPGLALFYGGMVRSKNVLAMLMQNISSLGIVTILWALVGYSLAFAPSVGGFVGDLHFAGMRNVAATVPPGLALTIPPLLFFVFQMTFAIITPALITGAIADRMRFGVYVAFICLWSILVYAPVAHWVFSPNGWLNARGALDFAGGTVVHINAGVAGLVGAIFLGRRRGWPNEEMRPHSLPLTLIGTGILWFGWFGFNAGSALAANGTAALAFVNTQLGAAGGMVAWLIAERWRGGHATTLGAASGAVAGLVAITPGAGFVAGLSAVAIGAVAGVVCEWAVSLKFRFGFDDSLDVVGVHLVGGLIGSVLVGVFATDGGLFSGGGVGLLGEQVLASVATLLYSGLVTAGILWVLSHLVPGGLRVRADAEDAGLDLAEHAEVAYTA